MVSAYNTITHFSLPIFKKLTPHLFVSVLLSVTLFSCLASLLYDIYPSSNLINCTIEFEKDSQVQIFYAPAFKGLHFTEKDSNFSAIIPGGKKHSVSIPLGDAPISHIRIDTGNKKGIIKLFKIEIHSVIEQSRILNYQDIFRSFEAGNADVKLTLKEDHVEISSSSPDPSIISNDEFTNRPWILIFGVPLLFALLLFYTLYNINLKKLKCIFIAEKKQPSFGTNFDALDGLRGFAALMVVADHTCGRLVGLGAPGVWIFMTLSGFLLAKPFIAEPERIVSFAAMQHFFIRRSKRIFPAYYTYIILVYVINGYFDLALRHFLFLEGDGHLWVIPQEILFYLLIPFIFLANHLILKKDLRLQIIFTGTIAILINTYLTPQVFSLYGMASQRLHLYFGVFLSGITAAYIYQWISLNFQLKSAQLHFIRQASSVVGPLSLLLLLFGSTMRIWGGTEVYAHIYFGWYGALAALLVLCISLAKDSKFVKFLTWTPFLCIGVVSFSYYLFHPLIMNTILYGTEHFYGHTLSGFTLFAVTALISYPIACLIFHFIEKPFTHPSSKDHRIYRNIPRATATK